MAESDDGGLDGFYSIDQLLHEEGLLQDAPSFEDIVDEHPAANLQNNRNKKDLSLEAKRRIVNHILESMKDGKIPRGTLVNLARQFGVHKSTIGRIYKDVQQQRSNGMCIDVRSKKIGKNGRKPKDYPEAWLQSVPLHLRTTERSFGGFLKISHVAVHRLKKRGKLRSHTASTHPLLTDTHKIKRMQWVLSHILHASVNRKLTFKPMRHVIHTDEKWFYMNPDTRRFYLLPREDDPHCCTVSKKFRVKAMFMGVISRPIYDQAGNLVFDGKFGIFPFTFKQKAVRSSKNRQAGTWETKPIQNITRGVIRDMLVNNVIPAIKRKWPEHLSKDLVIQWDNARPHVIPTDDEFVSS